jgi:iron complex outermembrane receptor protein
MKNVFKRTSYKFRSTKSVKTSFSILAAVLLSLPSFAQEETKDSAQTKSLEEVIVKATRADEKTPVTFSNFTKKDFSKRNLGQDIPVLMNYLPSVVTTTDAGNGVGYTGIRVRGSDATLLT